MKYRLFAALLALTAAAGAAAQTVIRTVDDMISFATSVNDGTNYKGGRVVVEADTLDFGGRTMPVIGNKENRAFAGTFDGCGVVLRNLVKDKSSAASCVALFGFVSGGTVQNVHLDATCSFTDCYNYIGGIVGHLLSGTVAGCTFGGTVGGSSVVGGIVGGMDAGSSVTDCHVAATARITAADQGAGGVVGLSRGTVTHCTSSASVSGAESVGGIIGNVVSGRLADCLVRAGTVSASTQYAGAVVGKFASCPAERNYFYTDVVVVVGTDKYSGQKQRGAGQWGTLKGPRDIASLTVGDTQYTNAMVLLTADAFPLGDATCSGTVDVLDVQLIVGYIVGREPLDSLQLQLADANADGLVTMADVAAIVATIVGREQP